MGTIPTLPAVERRKTLDDVPTNQAASTEPSVGRIPIVAIRKPTSAIVGETPDEDDDDRIPPAIAEGVRVAEEVPTVARTAIFEKDCMITALTAPPLRIGRATT